MSRNSRSRASRYAISGALRSPRTELLTCAEFRCQMTQRPDDGFGVGFLHHNLPSSPFLRSLRSSFHLIYRHRHSRLGKKGQHHRSAIDDSLHTLRDLNPVTLFREWIRCSTVALARYFSKAPNDVNCSEDSSLKIPARMPMTLRLNTETILSLFWPRRSTAR